MLSNKHDSVQYQGNGLFLSLLGFDGEAITDNSQ